MEGMKRSSAGGWKRPVEARIRETEQTSNGDAVSRDRGMKGATLKTF